MKNVPVVTHVVTSQISEQSFTDVDIIGSRVVVQLLMPLLIEVSAMLLDMMSVHDV